MGTSLSPNQATGAQRLSGTALMALVAAALVLGLVSAVLAFVGGAPAAGALALLAAVTAGALGWRLRVGLLRPAQRLGDFAAAFAEGDLTVSLDGVGAGDLAPLARSLEAALTRSARVVQALATSGSSLGASARLLLESSTAMSADFAETTGQASAASASAEQVSHNVTMVSTASHELTSSVTEVSRSTHEAAAVADEAVDTAEHTSEVMTRLGESSAEIGNVVKLITSIAAQTNLLALNATIEAARAGEAGRGFAVVAGEVKELAQETSRATDDISQRIQAIQSDTQGAVEAIGRIREVIERIAGYQTTIAGAVEEQSSTAAEMSRSLNEAATGSAHIADNVTGLATASQDALGQLSRAKGAAQEMVGLAQELQEAAHGFRLPAAQVHRPKPGTGGGVALDIPGVVSVRTDLTLKAVVVRWLRYDDFAVKPALEEQLAQIQQHGLRTVIVDSSDAVGGYSPEMNRWVGVEFVPRMSTTQVRQIVTVVSHSSLAEMSNREWQNGGRSSGLRMVEVSSMAEAEGLARQELEHARV